MPPGRRVSGMTVLPSWSNGRGWTRGSPVGGASTSSSSGTWCARASGSSSSSVGLRRPDSSRDRVLTEMPVASDNWASVAPRCRRSARRRGPTASRTSSSGGPSSVFAIPATVLARATVLGGPCGHERGRAVRRRGDGWGRGRPECRGGAGARLPVGAGGGRGRAAERARRARAQLPRPGGQPAGRSAGRRPRRGDRLRRAGRPPPRRRRPARGGGGGPGADGRAAVTGYGGRVVPGTVVAVERVAGEEPAFRIALADGHQVAARRLLVATGLVDELPDVPGVAERWGIDVLHCPYCHGWEARNQAIGILGDGPMAVHQALMWRQLSEDVTLFLHRAPKPSDDEREQLAARGIPVVEGEVAALEVSRNRLTGVRLVSGEVVPRQAVVVAPRFTARADLLAALGIEPVPVETAGSVVGSAVPADPAGATAIPGVWVAGNVSDLRAQVVSSAAGGLNTAAMINADLIAEDTRRAVAEARRVMA